MRATIEFRPRTPETLESRRVPSRAAVGAILSFDISPHFTPPAQHSIATNPAVVVLPTHAQKPASRSASPRVGPVGTRAASPAQVRVNRPAVVRARAVAVSASPSVPAVSTVTTPGPFRINGPSYAVTPGLAAGSSGVGFSSLSVTGFTTSPFVSPGVDTGLFSGFTTSPFVSPTTGDFVPFTTSPYVTPFGVGTTSP